MFKRGQRAASGRAIRPQYRSDLSEREKEGKEVGWKSVKPLGLHWCLSEEFPIIQEWPCLSVPAVAITGWEQTVGSMASVVMNFREQALGCPSIMNIAGRDLRSMLSCKMLPIDRGPHWKLFRGAGHMVWSRAASKTVQFGVAKREVKVKQRSLKTYTFYCGCSVVSEKNISTLALLLTGSMALRKVLRISVPQFLGQ